MNIQPILNIASICAEKGIRNAIISPGSRSAPITLGFANHPEIECKIINDERSAGFIALGMALQLDKPVVLVCTSGTATLNYAPAIAEAYYQQIPLIVITADRPPELIDQQDGQCLRQHDIYKNYIKKSFQTPDLLDSTKSEQSVYSIVNEAINLSILEPLGPTHINVPIREPFYPNEKVDFTETNFQSLEQTEKSTSAHFSELIQKINATDKVLFIAGQQRHSIELNNVVKKLVELNYPVITDINSNLCNVEGAIQNEDLIFQSGLTECHPELVITFGNSILSKKLKQYFRKHPVTHWHIAKTEPVPSFFHNLTSNYQSAPVDFLNEAINSIKGGNQQFNEAWIGANKQVEIQKEKVLSKSGWSEPFIINELTSLIPSNSHLHLSNSMTVRWFNMLGLDATKSLVIQSNRGVSGIDGCTSTAIGYSIASQQENFLITGDIAFFYDRNAFWNNFVPNNFKVLLLNNHEGGIFNMIPGPSKNKETLSYFTSEQNLTAKSLAAEFNLNYYFADSIDGFQDSIKSFIKSDKCSILELKTESGANKVVLDELKNISKSFS